MISRLIAKMCLKTGLNLLGYVYTFRIQHIVYCNVSKTRNQTEFQAALIMYGVRRTTHSQRSGDVVFTEQ